MKAFKIILVAIVIGIISFFIFKWTTDSGSGKGDGKPEMNVTNQFIPRVKKDIDSLKKLSNKDFNMYVVKRNIPFKSKNLFKGIQGDIDNFHDNNLLGKTSTQNTQEYKNLSKTLFSAYVSMFEKEVYYKLGKSRWKKADLTFIKSEIQGIKSNPFFNNQNSSYVPKFNKINNTISKYYKIVGFIHQCKGFPSNLKYSPSDRFPVHAVKSKINQSKAYLNNLSNINYVSNLTWLKNDLQNIPHKMYQKNFDFLKEQIRRNSGEYRNLASQPDYSNRIYHPLKRSIGTFDNSIYGVDYNSRFRHDHKKLMDMLNNDNNSATSYFL